MIGVGITCEDRAVMLSFKLWIHSVFKFVTLGFTLPQCYHVTHLTYLKIIYDEIYLNILFPGAGSELRGEGGSFLWPDVTIRLQRYSSLFPPCSLLHLPKPTDSTGTPPQNRCCLKPQNFSKQELIIRRWRSLRCSMLDCHYLQMWLTKMHPDHRNHLEPVTSARGDFSETQM